MHTGRTSSRISLGESTSRSREHSGIFVAAWVILLLTVPANVMALTKDASARVRPFTVRDEIGIAHFGDPYTGKTRAVTESPNAQYIAVETERGVLKENRVEDELRIYSMAAITRFLDQGSRKPAVRPLWTIREATYSEGPIISQIRWVSDSSAVAFLLANNQGGHQLVIALLRSRTQRVLSLNRQDVTAFDVRDMSHYAYTARSSAIWRREARYRSAVSVDVTGEPLYNVMLPSLRAPGIPAWEDRSDLWAAIGGLPTPVLSSRTHKPIVLFQAGQRAMSLSPDGRSLATVIPMARVPLSWESKYPPPRLGDAFAIRPGPQNLNGLVGYYLTGEYVIIDLTTGRRRPLTGAPTGASAGWWSDGRVAWAANGQQVLLPNTFASVRTGQIQSSPCVAVVEIASLRVQCLWEFARSSSTEFVNRVHFVGRVARRVTVDYRDVANGTGGSIEFFEASDGRWRRMEDARASAAPTTAPSVTVLQGLNQPPVLVATNPMRHISRVVWDPNPELNNIEIGKAHVYRWEDETGRKWEGGLYEPDTKPSGHRYPLVIQNHGFNANAFRSSGIYPTAFAARALAAAGIAVLQVRDCPLFGTTREVQCQISGYVAAIKQLTDDGVIDPERVGIIGFSRTVSYVVAAIADRHLHFDAASVTDGVDDGYWQYMMLVDSDQDAIERDAVAVTGAAPFGSGLNQWYKRSPEFELDKMRVPLVVVGEGVWSALFMWEPYAALRLLHRPVDMILLNTDEHVLTDPAARLASQGVTVDWFRFWLQGYESAHPIMADEYRRWEELCDMQIKENTDRRTWCVTTKAFRDRHSKGVGRVGN